MDKNISAPRIDWVDFAKGFVMLTVIFGHAAVYNHEAFFDISLILVYEFHMPFFFVLAGFLLNLDKWSGDDNYKKFSAKLFRRLLVPYYIAEILWYPIWFLAGHVLGHEAYIRNTALSPETALLGIFVGNGNLLALVPLWFLPALFFAELIFLKLYNRFSRIGDDIFALMIVVISYLGYIAGKIASFPMSLDIALTVQGFVFIGVLIRKYSIVTKLNLRHCLILLNIFVWAFFLNGKISMNIRDYGDCFLLYAGGVTGTLIIMKVATLMTSINGIFCKLMKYCGQQSLFVMTMHLLIAFITYDFVASATGLEVKIVRSLPEVIFAIILLGLLIPLLIAKKFGKLPVLKYFCS